MDDDLHDVGGCEYHSGAALVGFHNIDSHNHRLCYWIDWFGAAVSVETALCQTSSNAVISDGEGGMTVRS